MFKSLKYMENKMKSKKSFLASIHKAFLNQELSSSQKQAAIKMLEKRRQEIH